MLPMFKRNWEVILVDAEYDHVENVHCRRRTEKKAQEEAQRLNDELLVDLYFNGATYCETLYFDVRPRP
jgi:hypothetical protein